jgi:hypothetical protein
MKPLPRCSLHIRINHPVEADEETDFNFYADLSSIGYNVPLYHDYKEEDGEVEQLEVG